MVVVREISARARVPFRGPNDWSGPTKVGYIIYPDKHTWSLAKDLENNVFDLQLICFKLVYFILVLVFQQRHDKFPNVLKLNEKIPFERLVF